MKNYLLLDVGNTHVHMTVGNEQKLLLEKPVKLPLEKIISGQESKLPMEIQSLGTLDSGVLGSVVPNANERVTDWAKMHVAGNVLNVSHKTKGMVKIQYPNPETIGIDRLANAVACVYYKRIPSIVVDFGTATTFDVIDSEGAYIGGVIAPGLSLMTDYLHEKTALLPKISLSQPDRAIGKSTIEAMQIGALRGYSGLVDSIIRGIEHELKISAHITLTGGCTHLLPQEELSYHGNRNMVIDENLTLEGLRLLALAND